MCVLSFQDILLLGQTEDKDFESIPSAEEEELGDKGVKIEKFGNPSQKRSTGAAVSKPICKSSMRGRDPGRC